MLRKLFLALIICLPFQFALSPTEGVDLAVIRLAFLLLSALWLMKCLVERKIFVLLTSESFALATFLFLCLFSLFFAGNPVWGLRKALFLLSFAPVFLLASDLFRNRAKRYLAVTALAVSATAAACLALIQFIAQFLIGLEPVLNLWRGIMLFFLGQSFGRAVLDFPSWLVNIGGRTVFRAVGLFPDPHMLAFYLNLAWPWTLIWAWQDYRTDRRRSLFMGLATLLMIAAVLATYSRGAYVGMFSGLVCLFLYLAVRRSSRRMMLAIVLAAILLLSALRLDPVVQRFASVFDMREGSNSQRLENWKQARSVIREKWLTGTGLGNYPLAVSPTAGYRDPIYAHNLYLDILAETGIFGLLSWLLLVGFSAADFLKKSLHDRLYLGGALSILIFSVHSLFETPLFSVHVLPALLITLSLAQHDER